MTRCGGQRGFAEIDLRVGLRMSAECKEFARKMKAPYECRMQGIRKENEGFQRSLGVADRAESQKLTLEWALLWSAECKDFIRKMKDFEGQGRGRQRGLAGIDLRVGLSMECRMQGIHEENKRFRR